jgi:electron transport complex protein RnfG
LGIIAGGLLAVVNSFTAPIIEERQREAVMEALNEHFDYPEYFDRSDEYPVRTSEITAIYFAYDEGKVARVAVIYQVTTQGYGGAVVSLVGIKADGTFDDVAVVEAKNETPNLGTQIIGHDFGIKNESVNDYSYDTIGGATKSSEAVHFAIDIAAEHFIRHIGRDNE